MIFDIKTEAEFREAALETYHYQVANCEPYRQYVELLGTQVRDFEDIPFMPIELFKTHKIYGSDSVAEAVFTSSGTSGAETSRHYVASLELYIESFTRGFEYFYGQASDYSIFALLPSYMERQGSSLTLMVEKLQAQNSSKGGFYLYDFAKLSQNLLKAKANGEKIVLIGVTFALLDFAEQYNIDLSGAIVMETGGMKGRRREIARDELHRTLCKAFNVNAIHSEYGMTEMLSQCYSTGDGIFNSPPWVRVCFRSLQNPLMMEKTGGGINIVDLANRYSCSFLATGDRGFSVENGFEIAGRIKSEIIRGCNMLTE